MKLINTGKLTFWNLYFTNVSLFSTLNICVIKKSHVWPVERDEITQAKLVLLSFTPLVSFY